MRRSAGWLVVIVLAAVNLRPAVASVPPLIDQIAADLALSGAGAGVLTALPVVCMGLFAPTAAVLAARFGAERVLAGAVALIGVGTAGRALVGAVGLYVGTAFAGIGIAVAGALLPSLVKGRFPARIGPVTGLYTAGLIGGALLAASLTEPLRDGLGLPWPGILALWAVLAVVALVGLVPLGLEVSTVAGVVRARAPLRNRHAWWITAYMGLQSLLFYAVLAWLAARYTSLGLPTATAGLLLGVFTVTQLVSALGFPALAHRFGRDNRPWIALSAALSAGPLLLIAFAPLAAPWLWAGVLGLGVGGLFALALTVIAEWAPTPADAAALSGLAFFVGYPVAAVGPIVVGALRDVSGGYALPFAALAGLALVVLGVGWRAGFTAARVDVRPR